MTTISETWNEAYAAQRSKSRELYGQMREVIAGGVGHDMRYNAVAPTYITHGRGSHKWDVDGNEYIDYGMGNGALLVGHAHPAILDAVRSVVDNGVHFGNDHPAMLEWATLIHQLVPSAEKVRFTVSGTEASMLAIRLARAFTGREQILRLEGHFNGWHDAVGRGTSPPFQTAVSLGIPDELVSLVVVVPADLDRIEAQLRDNRNIAALILEPSGASWGTVPLTIDFNRDVRTLCDRYEIPLIYDEVVTGFRYSPGGYQALAGVKPDLSVLGKIISGGLPGAAVVGRADIMQLLEFTGQPRHDRYERVLHLGTFNANPLTTAAGIASLQLVADGQAQAAANRAAQSLRDGIEQILDDQRAAGYVYGDASVFHIFVEAAPGSGARTRDEVHTADAARLKGIPGRVVSALQRNLQLRGVDLLSYTGGLTSAVHSVEDIRRSLTAFEETIHTLLSEDIVAHLSD